MTEARDLADLRKQILHARAMLAGMHKATIATARQQTSQQATAILAASEQLVVAALRAQSAEFLIDCADMAMYRAKLSGVGGFAFYGELPSDESSNVYGCSWD